MKIKETYNVFTYVSGVQTIATKLITIDMEGYAPRIFKFTYRTYNAGEDFVVELFSGHKLSRILTIADLGILPDKSAYNLSTEKDARNRFEILTKKALKFIENLY